MKDAARLIVIAVSLVFQPVHAADTLLDIYQLALRNDPQLREAEANRLATLESKPQALGLLLPQVDANAGYDDTKSMTSAVRSSSSGIPAASTSDGRSSGWNWGLQVRQTLFRWDQWVSLIKADKQVAQAEMDFLAAQQNLATRVATAYFDVLAAQDTLESEQASKKAIGQQLEQARKRFEVGLIAITDVQEAQAAYDNSVASEITAKRTLANAREALREITGQYTETLAAPVETFPLIGPDPEDQNAWVDTALKQNAALRSADIGAEIARDDVNIARNGHLPTVDLVLGHRESDTSGTSISSGSFNPTPTAFPTSNTLESDQVQVQIAVPIFKGGATNSKRKQAIYLHRAARERFERTARETERKARDAYLGVISEIARVKALKQALASAQTALEASEAGFEVGTRTTVDVLIARQNLFKAETDYARARYDYIVNVLLLKEAAGTLSRADIEAVNQWLVP